MKPEPTDDIPSPQEVRATVERMTASETFGRSPQLAAFLRFVVEAVLEGRSDRIKGYTIAVEVLRRDSSFDPQSDPIVRVEATRLRRTIERYYASTGADDPVIIDLPRGTYVPTFRRRHAGPAPRAFGHWIRAGLDAISRRSLVLAAIAFVGLGAVGVAMLLPSARAPPVGEPPSALPPGNGMPVLVVEGLDLTGTPALGTVSPALLSEKIRDAFSRFDTINIAIDPKDSPIHRVDYRFLGSVEYHGDSTATFRFRVLDTADGNIVWSQTFDRVLVTSEAVLEQAIVLPLATALMQTYGVLRGRDRAKHLASGQGDPRYRCLLEASDALRHFDPAGHARGRACLERLTVVDPSFAVGYSLLSVIYYREFLYGYGARAGDSPPLDRALRAVQRAIELNPASARGYQMLFFVLFSHGDIAAAFAAGDKAMALNPYEMLTVAEYGGRLITMGETERGMAMLRRAGEYGAVRPSSHHFYMFLGNYLRGDMTDAARHAGQITAENYSLGHLAKALAAAALGDSGRARQAVDRLEALQPSWRDDPRGELGKIVPKPEIVDRLARDLATARLGGRS
jgi:tetratricopeptide (TPR) repeat protein